MRICVIVLLGLTGGVQPAAAADVADDGMAWLKKMAAASRQLNYSGTIVYQHRNHVETSKVVHYVNAAGGEFEKLETLDGPPREVIRSNDQVVCYLPAARTVLIEERNRNSRNFPALVPESLRGISGSYEVRKEEVDRVAGHDCQWIALVPRDDLRYGRRFCAEVGSSLPLRAQTLDPKGERIESFAFTQVTIGGSFNRERVKSKYEQTSRAQRWRVDRSGVTPPSPAPADTGWVLTTRLPGFKKVMEAKRSIGGRSGAVSQIVFSDGMTAVSVFIEPMPAEEPAPALSYQGAVNIYKRPRGNHVVTVLGEAPAATIMQIANSLELKPTAGAMQ